MITNSDSVQDYNIAIVLRMKSKRLNALSVSFFRVLLCIAYPDITLIVLTISASGVARFSRPHNNIRLISYFLIHIFITACTYSTSPQYIGLSYITRSRPSECRSDVVSGAGSALQNRTKLYRYRVFFSKIMSKIRL